MLIILVIIGIIGIYAHFHVLKLENLNVSERDMAFLDAKNRSRHMAMHEPLFSLVIISTLFSLVIIR